MTHFNQLLNKITACKFQSGMRRETCVTVMILLVFCLFVTPSIKQSAFSDGLFQENLPPATVGDRQASLFTKVSPPVLTSDSHQKRFFELRLYDAKTGNNITNVNYFITVTKAGKLLMRDLFYSKAGPLRIEINPRPGRVQCTVPRNHSSEVGRVKATILLFKDRSC